MWYSIWLRNAVGTARGDRTNPYANFFFGGFGNNYVDYHDEKRYREYWSLPGAPLNGVAGRTFLKGTAEWNLPPVRFSRLGTPGFYASWLRPAVFATVLGVNLDAASARRTVTSVGGQLDLRLTVLHALNMTVSAGAAMLRDQDGRTQHQVMASFTVLR